MTKRDIQSHRSEQPDPLCDSVQTLLPGYVTAEALGQHTSRSYRDVAAHLHTCAHCREALDELRALTIDAYNGVVAPAPSYPQPNLAFLSAQPAAAQPWRIDEWGRLIVVFSQALLDSLRPPALAGAARGQLLYSYTLQPPGLDVQIDVFATGAQIGFVRINVESLDRDPLDQTPSQVVARAAGATWHGTTDESGCIAFDAVPLADLPHLTIEIATDQAAQDGAAA
ncbi:MAG: hypothetical protein JOZ51_11130 [Chloroflexi bacterium]|nr:hypothetical protein [Chloroflexota bacterium]